VSYQPEERYWTDYLRIAFPVLGLLLLLGLFWFWAMALIDNGGNGGGGGGNGTTVAGGTLPTPTATPTQAGGDLRTPPLSTVATTPDGEAGGNQTASNNTTGPKPTRTPRATGDTPTSAPTGKFKKDDLVVTNGQANMRSAPAMGDNVVTTLDQGTELTVTDNSVVADNHTWVPVDDSNGHTGWVAEELLDPSG
jgi:uncharacterized protein YgiM (DUF1202 family)